MARLDGYRVILKSCGFCKTLHDNRTMICDDHWPAEVLYDFKQFLAIDVVVSVQSSTCATAVHNVRGIDERHGTRIFRKLS